MKVFIFYIGTPSPIFETDLELIRKHEKLGDSVRVLQCSGGLPNCHWNQIHRESQCAVCRSKFVNGWNVLNAGKEVELKQFPKSKIIDSNYIDLFNSVDDIKRYQYDGEKIGYGVVSALGSIFRDHRFDTKKYRNEIARELRTAVEVYKSLKQEFQEFRPDRVYFFNGRITTHLPAKLLCRKMGIEYFSYETSNKKSSYRALKNSTVHEVIPIEVVNSVRSSWNKDKAETAKVFFHQNRLGKDFDNKVRSFTKDQLKGFLPNGFNRNKKNIAIFNGTIDEYAGVEDFKNRIYEPDETKGIQIILESFAANDQYMFYLRVHPNMKTLPSSTSQLQDITELGLRFSNLCIIWPDDPLNTYDLMDACEKVITFGSTTGIEATYWGKPSILANNATYENFGCAYTPKNHEELVRLIEEDLSPLSADSAMQYVYWLISDGIPFEYFKETGVKNGLAIGTFDGIEIKSSILPRLWYQADIFLWRTYRIFKKPSLIIIKLRHIFRRDKYIRFVFINLMILIKKLT
jgi:hypothetical protein